MTRPRRQPDPAYEVPLDSASWWPLGVSVDEWRAERLSTGERPVYFTEARERAEREWGRKAGLRDEPLEHEVESEEP